MDDARIQKLIAILERHHETWRQMLMAMAHKRGFGKQDAEDIAQLAFLHVLLRIRKGKMNWVLERFDTAEAIKYFLLRYSLRDALTRITGRRKRQKADDDGDINLLLLKLCLYNEYLLDQVANPDNDMEEKLLEKLNLERDLERLERAMRQLSDEERQLLEWYYVQELSHEEIAKLVQCSPEAVKQKLYRIREKLRKLLDR